MIRSLSFLFCFLFVACGKRDIENLLKNPFLGEWKLSKISCSYQGLSMEEYQVPESTNITLSFKNGLFYYDLETQCSLIYQGDYQVRSTKVARGEISFFPFEEGFRCQLGLFETEENERIDVPLNWIENPILRRKWAYELQSDTVTIDNFTAFNGSTSLPLGCHGNCSCAHIFKKIN